MFPATSFDLGAMLQWLGVLGSLLAFGGGAYFSLRSLRVKMLEEERDGWERLARLRTEEMSLVRERLSDLERRLGNLQAENGELRALNIALQSENQDQKAEIKELREAVSRLERELHALSNH